MGEAVFLLTTVFGRLGRPTPELKRKAQPTAPGSDLFPRIKWSISLCSLCPLWLSVFRRVLGPAKAETQNAGPVERPATVYCLLLGLLRFVRLGRFGGSAAFVVLGFDRRIGQANARPAGDHLKLGRQAVAGLGHSQTLLLPTVRR